MTIRLVPAEKAQRFECFDCGVEVLAPYGIERCPRCGSEDEFYLMN